MFATVIWGVISVALLLGCLAWRSTPREDGHQYRHVPWSFFWFALVSTGLSWAWPLFTGGLPGWATSLLVALWVGAGAIVAFSRFGVGRITAIALAVALPLLGIAGPAIAQTLADNGSSPSATASPSATPSASPSEEATPDPKADATVDPTEAAVYPDRYLKLLKERGYKTETVNGVEVPVFTTCSTEYDAKLWTDSVCPPLDPKDRASVLARILGSPDYAAHVASGLSRVEVIQLDGSKISLAEINPWLKEFSDPATINDWAQSAMEARDANRVDYAKKLVLVALLTERFSDGGVQGDRETAFNFRLADGKNGSLKVDPSNPLGAIPEFELSAKQYKGEFLVFRVAYKGFEGCFAEFGINTGDGRFAGFTCETPKPKPPVETPPPGTPPTDNPPPTKPPVDKCVQPDKPGPGYTWNEPACKWEPPKPEVCKWNPNLPKDDPNCKPPVEVCEWNPNLPKDDPNCKPPVEVCPLDPNLPKDSPDCIDKPDKNNPEDPAGVDPQPQPDPVESEPPAKPEHPVDPGETPGDPIGPGDDGQPETPVDGNEGGTPPSDPPVEDPKTEPQPENPGTEIVDPDNAPALGSLFALPLLGLGLVRRRKAA